MSRYHIFNVANAIEANIATSYRSWLVTRKFDDLIELAILQRSLLLHFNSDFIGQFSNVGEIEFWIPREWRDLNIRSKKIKKHSVIYIVKQILKVTYCFIFCLYKIFTKRNENEQGSLLLMDVFTKELSTFSKSDLNQSWPAACNDDDLLQAGRKGKAGFASQNESVLLIKSTSSFKLITSYLQTFYYVSIYTRKYGFSASFGMLTELYKYLIFDQYQINEKTELLYSASAKIYRPLWTYKLDDIGAQTSCYFYSTNHVQLNRENWVRRLPLGFCSMTWNKYYLWDDPQMSFFQKTLGLQLELEKCGGISIPNFTPKSEKPTSISKPYIAVFDVTPFEDEYVADLFAVHPELHSGDIMSQFVDDIIMLGSESGLDVVIKTKRSIGLKFNQKYLNKLRALSNKENIHVFYDEADPEDIITDADLAISYPFTSTSIIAKNMGKPSYYYDPTASILPCLNVDRDIALIPGIDELRSELRRLNDRS